METITKNINLNISQPNNYQLVHAMQGDHNTVEIIATIWNGNQLYTIGSDHISLEWQSPSGAKKDYPVKEHGEHTVTFLLKSEMLAENGDHTFCFRFDGSDNAVIRTFCSTMKVTRAPFGHLMDSEVVTLTQLVNEAKSYYNKLIAEKGQPNGIATLDQNGQVPSTQLPNSGGVTGIKGEKESVFRHGDVSISPDDIGAIPFKTIADRDFNSMINPGFYAMHNSSNAPTSENIHSLIVLDSTKGLDTSIQQIAIPIKKNEIYMRHYNRFSMSTVVWSGWVRLPDTKDLDELKKSVSDGKSSIASAITALGVSTASDAAFSNMAYNISRAGDKKYSDGKSAGEAATKKGNAIAANVLSGKTFTSINAGVNQTGTMPNFTNVKRILTGDNSSSQNGGYSISGNVMRVCPPTGYHDYQNTSWENAMQIEIGDASANDVLSGKRFTSSAGRNVSGNIISARATGAKQFGSGFPVAASGYPYFCLHYLDHISYNEFGLHYVINTYSWGSIASGGNDQAIIRVGGSGGTINVLRSSWTFDATNYNRMVVTMYGKSDYVGGSMEFRGCIGVCAKGAAYATSSEGRDYAMSYGTYQFNSTSSGWLSNNIVVDLSWINQEVQFHMSTVHSGEVYLNSIAFVPN